jgi:hypothetical protein
VTWPAQDLFDAFYSLLLTAPGSPSLVAFDGKVNDGAVPPYAKVDFYIETPDGLMAPDAISLTGASTAIDAVAYVRCVGGDPQAARAARGVSGRVRAAVLDQDAGGRRPVVFPDPLDGKPAAAAQRGDPRPDGVRPGGCLRLAERSRLGAPACADDRGRQHEEDDDGDDGAERVGAGQVDHEARPGSSRAG